MSQPASKKEHKKRQHAQRGGRGGRPFVVCFLLPQRKPRALHRFLQQVQRSGAPDWNAAWNTWSYEYNDDYYKGRLYTSFDPSMRNTGAARAPERRSAQDRVRIVTILPLNIYRQVVPINKAPEDMKTETFLIDANEFITFSGNREWLSTFYHVSFDLLYILLHVSLITGATSHRQP